LFESELFGVEKGAFTGANQSKPGLVEMANGGTLFLDEICEMPTALQVKLLRMLEERSVRRVGGKRVTEVNLRVLSATNGDLETAVKEGNLREDLFFRINTIQITVPPLRERRGDLSILTKFFLSRLEQSYGLGVTEIQSEALDIMDHYPWPGNVRELRNVIERSYYLASPPLITTKDLPAYLCEKNPIVPGNWKNKSYRDAKELVLEAFEREYVAYHLEQNNWNISRTAEQCAIDRRTIHRLINKFNLRKSSGNGKH
ncbi:MAG: sigma-54-dependent Fis family transcriptional regulator, partial [Calditrichaeota bacterium]|nr:sigma-54-dependent Fis family transcriptional regulator [Calditrichota bacterium]